MLLSALASPRRQEILRLVWTQERSAGDIRDAMPDVTFGAVSQHLKTLTDAGLLHTRAEGRHRFFLAKRDALGPMAAMLEHMWNDALWRLTLAAELEHSRRGPRARRKRGTRNHRSTTP
jgi:DNA-binding transcriptional ArsR family regulator